MNRRTLMKWLVQAGGLVAAGAVAIPSLIATLSPALKGRRGEWRRVGRVEEFPVGSVREAALAPPRGGDWPHAPRQGVYVWRPEANRFVIYSSACTDLGCPVNWDQGSQTFLCPCHGGIFSKDGERMAGPPERPLYRYDARVRDGVLEIDPASVPPML